jgi:CRISPR-associated protein Csm3
MYGKIKITAIIEVLTGMHIGGSNTFSAIGAVDSPVIRDTLSGNPIIPGSSLKGKMRTLLVKALQQNIKPLLPDPNDDKEEVKRLFGTSKKPIYPSRLQFSDAFIINAEELKEIGVTEVKFENAITRATSIANPRQIERVIRGTKFGFVLIYDAVALDEIDEDFSNIATALRLLQMDYLGGHGTRGYGKIKFSDFSVECVAGELNPEKVTELNNILKDVEKDAILSL